MMNARPEKRKTCLDPGLRLETENQGGPMPNGNYQRGRNFMFRSRKSTLLLLIPAFATAVYAQFDQGQISGAVRAAAKSSVGQPPFKTKTPEPAQSATQPQDRTEAFPLVNFRAATTNS